MEKMAQKILSSGIEFPAVAIIFFATSLFCYFIMIRWICGALIIRKKKLSRKERKQREDELWNRTRKQQMHAFGKWLLFLSYKNDESISRFLFYLLGALNYIYLLINALFLIIWIAGFFSNTVQVWCLACFYLKVIIIDYPLVGLISILFLLRNGFKKFHI